jgi:hypothetical protein
MNLKHLLVLLAVAPLAAMEESSTKRVAKDIARGVALGAVHGVINKGITVGFEYICGFNQAAYDAERDVNASKTAAIDQRCNELISSAKYTIHPNQIRENLVAGLQRTNPDQLPVHDEALKESRAFELSWIAQMISYKYFMGRKQPLPELIAHGIAQGVVEGSTIVDGRVVPGFSYNLFQVVGCTSAICVAGDKLAISMKFGQE